MVTSDLVRDHSSHPYSKIGMQGEEYSLKEVQGCKHPNREPTAFKAKNALRAEEHRSVVQKMHSMQKNIVQWYDELMMEVHYAEFLNENGCRILESHHHASNNHFREDRFLLRETGDSPKTEIADFEALNW